MRIIETDADVAEGVAELVKIEPRFGVAVAACGPIPLRRRDSGFVPLMQALVGQQISVAAATGIWNRIEAAKATTPKRVLAMSEDELRALGLSGPKVRYAKAIAEAVRTKVLCFDSLREAQVTEALAMLTAVKGIGPWTAEIYLMFSIGHADVFAAKDLALQESARVLFDLDERPTDKEIAAMAEAWSPWRAVAARVLWDYYLVVKGRKGIAD